MLVLVDLMAEIEQAAGSKDPEEAENFARPDLICHATSRYGAERADLANFFECGRHRHTTTTGATIDLVSSSRVSNLAATQTHVSWARIRRCEWWYIF